MDILLQGPDGTRRDMTDGSGILALVDLPAGEWRVNVTPAGESRTMTNCPVLVEPGRVNRVDLETSPTLTSAATCSTNQSSRLR